MKRIFLGYLCLMMWAVQGRAQITLDATVSSSTEIATSLPSFNITVDPSATVLCVCAASRNGVNTTQPTVTYNGVAMTKAIGLDDTNTYAISSLWYTFNPTSGTHGVVVDYGANLQTWIVGVATSLKGTVTSGVDDTGSAFVAAANSITLSNLSTVAANAVIVDCLGSSTTAATMVASTNRVQRANITGFATNGTGASSTVIVQASPGSNTMEWDFAGNNAALSAVSFAPTASATTGSRMLLMGVR